MAKKKLNGSTLAEEKPLILTNIVYKNPLNCQSMQSKHTMHSMDTIHSMDTNHTVHTEYQTPYALYSR